MSLNPYESPQYIPPWAKGRVNVWKGIGIAALTVLATPFVIGLFAWLMMLVDMILLPLFFGR